jgi:hypothetical protein
MAKAKTAFSQAGRIALLWCLSLLATKSGQLFARTVSLVLLIALGHSTIQTTVTLSDKYPASSPVYAGFVIHNARPAVGLTSSRVALSAAGGVVTSILVPFPDEGEALLAG